MMIEIWNRLAKESHLYIMHLSNKVITLCTSICLENITPIGMSFVLRDFASYIRRIWYTDFA